MRNPIKKHEDKDTAHPQVEWFPSTIYAHPHYSYHHSHPHPMQTLLYKTHKNHKHNASTDTALGESYTTRQQHNPHSERGHASLCKETGQVYYSTPEDGEGEADSSHQIYNRLAHDTHNTGEQSQATAMNSTLQGNYEMGEYSTVSNCRQPHDRIGEEVSTAVPQLLHYQVDNELKNQDKYTIDSQEEHSPSTIYALVDKNKSKKKEKILPQTPEPYMSLEQNVCSSGQEE